MEKLLKRPNEREMSLPRIILAGAGSGFGSTLILTPVELIKCRLQVKNDYKGPIDCVRRAVAAEGVTGLYRGLLSTLMREVPGNAAWFGTYHFFGRALSGKESVKDGTQFTQLVAGGLAGMAYWGVPFPIDTIKSEVQTKPSGTSTLQVAKQLLRERGIKGMYRGCGVTLVRAFPGNAVTFWMYERVMNLIHRKPRGGAA
jgi:solute carrier family 25 (mitochondrial carnitine/acylcarnitine transporter), member 20/29